MPASRACTEKKPCEFAMIADLDSNSKTEIFSEFRSYIFRGYLHYNSNSKSSSNSNNSNSNSNSDSFTVRFDKDPFELRSKLNEGGRGLELSELIYYNRQLLTMDDRTGAVFEISVNNGSLIPRLIIAEGDGNSSKGMKIEWATKKSGELFVGGIGREFVDASSGKIKSEANFWIAIINKNGRIERKNWKSNFNALRKKMEVEFPGYMVHESVNWSSYHKRWIFLPRRVSKEPYNANEDERKGANVILIAAEDFSDVAAVPVLGDLQPERGFSAFKFVPGTDDLLLLAIRSAEDSREGTQKSFVTVLETFTGRVILQDLEVPHQAKYEGVEFLPRGIQFSFFKK